MKYLQEYRNAKLVKELLKEIKGDLKHEWCIMEICGGQTHSLVKNGLMDLLPDGIELIHGPGCPVCVTPAALIDQAIELAKREHVILCSFGDMIRVPGTQESLAQAKTDGAEIRVVYSPLDALKIASSNPGKEVVFFAVGFETTAPANAISVIQAKQSGINNYSILTSHVLVPPAIEAILSDPECRVDGFLAAGHVCTIMGDSEYHKLVDKFSKPIVITGFEPVDLLQGIHMLIGQLENGDVELQNQYARVVRSEGNTEAMSIMQQVFITDDREWRGIGTIPKSGYEVQDDYAYYDAKKRFNLAEEESEIENDCRAGDVLTGKIKPTACPQFGKRCIPLNPLGAPMVSSEGACAAYYHYYQGRNEGFA